MHVHMYTRAHTRAHTHSHSQRWLIARWWKIMCDLTDWWICFCFGHPSMNRDICKRANTHIYWLSSAHIHTHTQSTHHYTHVHAQGYRWQVTDGQWQQPLCKMQTQEMIHLLKVKKNAHSREMCMFAWTHIIVNICECASMCSCKDVCMHAHVCVCICLCMKELILGNSFSLSLVVDEWLGVRSWLRNCRVLRLYNVFTTQTDSYTTAYYWPSKPPHCTAS